jgi:hypothetical protein
MFTPVAHSRQAILWVGRQPAAYAASFHPRIRPGSEGRFDGEWLNRQVQAAEDGQRLAPFGSVFGIAPTEDAAVVRTVEVVNAARRGGSRKMSKDSASACSARPPAPQPGYAARWHHRITRSRRRDRSCSCTPCRWRPTRLSSRPETRRGGSPAGSPSMKAISSGCSSSNRSTWVTHIPDTPSRWASAARFFTRPARRSSCHSRARRSCRTTGGGSAAGGRRGFGLGNGTTTRFATFMLESRLGRHAGAAGSSPPLLCRPSYGSVVLSAAWRAATSVAGPTARIIANGSSAQRQYQESNRVEGG